MMSILFVIISSLLLRSQLLQESYTFFFEEVNWFPCPSVNKFEYFDKKVFSKWYQVMYQFISVRGKTRLFALVSFILYTPAADLSTGCADLNSASVCGKYTIHVCLWHSHSPHYAAWYMFSISHCRENSSRWRALVSISAFCAMPSMWAMSSWCFDGFLHVVMPIVYESSTFRAVPCHDPVANFRIVAVYRSGVVVCACCVDYHLFYD